jgi:hypothetical protein
MADTDRELRLNLEFLSPEESVYWYKHLGKDGTISDEPVEGSIRVAIVKQAEGRYTTRLLPTSYPQ